MQLVNPGFWITVGLFGIITTLLGTSILAYIKSNHASKVLKQLSREIRGDEAISTLERIVEDQKTVRRDEGCDELIDILSQQEIKYNLRLDINSGENIDAIGYDGKRVSGDIIKLINRNGENQNFVLQDFEELLSRIIDNNMKNMQDRFTMVSWIVVAIGFLLQILSYFVRHFVV